MESAGMLIRPRDGDTRSPERIRAHYLVEREIADRLRRAAGAEERRHIFGTMYEELFRRVPDHPRAGRDAAAAARRRRGLEWDMALLRRYLKPGGVFLEIGAGDCALSRRVAVEAGRVYAVDIADQTGEEPLPANVRLVISDGRSVPVPPASVDTAFSDQLMEHLHPDDAVEQLRGVFRALKPGGVYVCITPNRMYGPTDVSGYFDEVARGFHLHEYTLGELRALFASVGFTRFHVHAGARGHYVRFPAAAVILLERILGRLPYRLRRRIADTPFLRPFLGLRLAAFKPEERGAA